ncbi:MAG TPA: SGNH/GDSL hydrolase family protein [Puia sp.]|nr:SGNH/GDSL hydrolase family protein [Puia sp.]
MPTKPVPVSKKLLYYSIMIVVLLMIIELCSRAYYYQGLSPHPIASIQVLKDFRKLVRKKFLPDSATKRLLNNHYLIRPELPRAENDRINTETALANQAVYEPWVEFAFRDIQSKYVNVKDHIRRSVPERSDSLSTDSLTVFFLGGSTMYGFNVTDAETIPACFVKAYQKKYPHGTPIHVVNYGTPSYFSYQELILLVDRILHDQKPDMVVMLDGLNDCLQARSSYAREPLYKPGFGEFINPGGDNDRTQFADFYELPAGMKADSACTLIYQRYIDNIRHAREIAGFYGISLYCFWQPVPYYNYPNRVNDPICTKSSPERFGYIYPLVKNKARELDYLFFLGDMLEREKGLPFIDQIHYSPDFNRAVAENILQVMSFKPRPQLFIRK